MTKSTEAVFQDGVLRLLEPLDIAPNTRVRITVEVPEAGEADAGAFLRIAQGLRLNGPADWSERVEDYLQSRHGGDGDGTVS